jgi:hypothetical protein
MKIKVYVIDLPVPTAIKKWGLRVGVPAFALLASGVAFAGLPGGYADGQPLTAEILSNNFNYLQSEITAEQGQIPVITAWQTYVPTISVGGTDISSTATTAGRWRRVGDTAEVQIESTFTTGCSLSGQVGWSFPPGVTQNAAESALIETAGYGLSYNGSTVTNVTVTLDTRVTAAVPELQGAAGGGLKCGEFGAGWVIRMKFEVPASGWTVTGP